MKSPLYLTYNEMFYQLIFSILSSFLAGYIAFIFFEAPVSFAFRRISQTKRIATLEKHGELIPDQNHNEQFRTAL
jgi:hypothetical protein